MGPNCGGGFAGTTPRNLPDAALEPVAADAAPAARATAAGGLREAAAAAFGAMAEQIMENSENRMREDVAEMLGEADAAALAEAEAAAEEAAADKRREAQDEGPAAQAQLPVQPRVQQAPQADVLLHTAGISAYAAAQSAMIDPESGERYEDRPEGTERGALTAAMAI